jgi:type II secretory pathway pseudopilin PulG
MNKNYKKRYFSLIELIAVIAIILLISGIAVTQLGRSPAFASLNNNAEGLIGLFTSASLRALSTGNPQTVTYLEANQTFSINETAENSMESSIQQVKEVNFNLANGVKAIFYNSASITDEEAEIDIIEDIKFTCYPDGSITGPDIELQLRKQKLKLHISPLTGAITIIKPE